MSVEEVTLSYVSALQSTETVYGSTKYQVLFDASLVELGNIIMFEYKIQDVDTSANMNNTSFGFVSIENAIQSGIANQYIISVPAEAFTNNLDVTNTIQVRVYTGTSDNTNNVNITNWSNELNVYNPPGVPIIYSAFYDPSDNNISDLYVYMDISNNPAYNYEGGVNFIVCYYYQDPSGNTIWGTSEPLVSTSAVIGVDDYRQLLVSQFGTVGTDNDVYVSVHAVYSWNTDVSNNYYAISYMSNELPAEIGNSDATPNITSLVYNVYQEPPMDPPNPEIPGTQTMTIQWNAPGNSALPYYEVANYSILASVNDGSFNLVVSDLSSTLFTYDVDVSNQLHMSGTDYVQFQVLATTVNDQLEYSDVSSTMYYFQYAEAPSELAVTSSSYDTVNGLANISIFFQGISDSQKGPGTGNYYVVEIDGNSNDGSFSYFGDLTYVPDASYNIEFININVSPSANISVYLVTTDTNSEELLNGDSTTIPYIAVDTNFQYDVQYRIYDLDTQRMDLQWTPPSAPNWSVDHYEIWVNLNNTEFLFDVSLNGNTYGFEPDVSSLNNYQFQIYAVMTNVDTTTYTIKSNIVSENTFTYASAPTELVISNVSTDGDVDMTVSFQGVDDSGKGLGDGLQYVVEIDGTTPTPSSGSLSYVSGQSYEIQFIDISVNLVGLVRVYLQTQDTNSSTVEDGAAIEAPYIATSITLNPVDYSVYTEGQSQVMNLSWNTPAGLGDWSVDHYDVYVNEPDMGWSLDASTNSTIYPYVPTGEGNYVFEIHAILTNDVTTYEVISNPKDENYFSFPNAPVVTWNWAVDNQDETMDVNLTFYNPTESGVTSGFGDFTVNILDASENIVDSTDVSYNSLASYYPVNFNDIVYLPSGSIQVVPTVFDTNEGGQLVSLNPGSAGFTTAVIPVFINVTVDASNISMLGADVSGNIITATPLAPFGQVIYPLTFTGPQADIQIQTNQSIPGFTITGPDTLEGGTLMYSFYLTAQGSNNLFGDYTPPGYAILVSNSAGIGVQQVIVNLD